MSSIPNSFSHVLLRTFYDRFSPRGKRPLNPFQRSAQACAFYEVVFLASKTKASPVSAAGHSVTDPALKVIKKKNKAKPANIPRCTPGSFWQGKASPPCPRPFRNPSSGRRARQTDGRTDGGGGGKGGGSPAGSRAAFPHRGELDARANSPDPFSREWETQAFARTFKADGCCRAETRRPLAPARTAWDAGSRRRHANASLAPSVSEPSLSRRPDLWQPLSRRQLEDAACWRAVTALG